MICYLAFNMYLKNAQIQILLSLRSVVVLGYIITISLTHTVFTARMLEGQRKKKWSRLNKLVIENYSWYKVSLDIHICQNVMP